MKSATQTARLGIYRNSGPSCVFRLHSTGACFSFCLWHSVPWCIFQLKNHQENAYPFLRQLRWISAVCISKLEFASPLVSQSILMLVPLSASLRIAWKSLDHIYVYLCLSCLARRKWQSNRGMLSYISICSGICSGHKYRSPNQKWYTCTLKLITLRLDLVQECCRPCKGRTDYTTFPFFS